jgi:tape measure domain-containing protein
LEGGEELATVGNLTAYLYADITDYERNMRKAQEISKTTAASMGVLAAAMGAVATKSVIMAAEMEQTQISFEVMLGSAERAQKMVSELYEMGAKTPYESKDLLRNAQIMMQYGVSADKTKEYLRMLGDVASGNADKLHLLTYAFSQVQATGRLTGQDLLQMINSGFNPLQIISEKTGRSIMQLKKDMENGAISSQMVAEAFKIATGEGGRFFNMMEKQSKTLGGLWSTLKDSVSMSLTKIGEDIVKTFDLKSKTQGAINLVDTLSKAFLNLPEPIRQTAITMAGVTTALIGMAAAIAGIKLALGTLSISFGPFLLGGAIITGVMALASAFAKVAENTRLAKLQVSEIDDLVEAQKKKKWLEDRIQSRVTTIVKIEKDIKNVRYDPVLGQEVNAAYAGAEEAVAKMRTELQDFYRQRLDVEAQIKNILGLNKQTTETKPETPDFDFKFDLPKFELDKFMAESMQKLANINTASGMGISGYDALQERVNLFGSMIDEMIKNGVDPQSDAMVQTIWRFNYLDQALKDREAAEKEAAKAAKETSIPGITHAEEMGRYFGMLGDKAKELAAEFSKAKKEFFQGLGNQLLSKAPIANSVIQGATQGAQFGPWGAIAGALVPLITSSKTFQTLMDNINPLLQALADAVGKILEPILPLVTVISTVLSPVFTVLGTILSSVLMPVMEALFPVFKFLGIIVLGLAQGIAWAWNAIATGINFVLGWIPNWVNLALIDTGNLSEAMETLTNLTWNSAMATAQAAGAMNDLTESILNAPTGFKVAAYRFNAIDVPGYANGTTNHPGGPAIVGEKGPELLNLPSGSSVTPLEAGGVVQYITINSHDAEHTYREIKRLQERDNTRNNGLFINSAPQFSGGR